MASEEKKDENVEEKKADKKEVSEEEGKRYSGGVIPRSRSSKQKKED